MIIYLLILIILLLCILIYDIREERRYREFHIRIITIILILVSGFAYRLGGDGISYLEEWKQYGDISDINYNYLTSFSGRMPGWVFLCTLCKTIIDSNWFFKLIHATFVNVAYVYVIKNNAKYVFSSILFYFILIYFNQNFQILRESLAISFFLYGLPYLNSGKWIKYYIFAMIAISFHIGAVILLIIPFVKILGINKYSILLYLIAGFLFIRYASDFIEMVMNIKIDGDIQGKIYYYTNNLDTQYDFVYWGNSLLNIFFPMFIIIFYYKKKIICKYLYPVIMSIILYLISLVLPIAYRFSNYFLIFGYMLIADFIISRIMLFRWGLDIRQSLIYCFLIVYLLFKSRFYFSFYGDTDFPSYVQYYPYASIFEKYEDPTRERLYNVLK